MANLIGAVLLKDLVAILGTLRTAGIPKSLNTKIAGESRFKDGMGIVVFFAICFLIE